jgi:hypothetical protein
VHFAVLLVTDEKPTQEILEKTLVQFGPADQEYWDSWEFGGRFSGNLIPVVFENVLTAGPELRRAGHQLVGYFDIKPER